MENNLTGVYPIILDGEKTGELSVFQEGLFWVFEANNMMTEKMLRLSVYGGGREGYLGIMEPLGEGLHLKKSFSRSSLSDFPKSISYASRKDALISTAEEKENAPVPKSGSEDTTDDPSPLSEENSVICPKFTPPYEIKPPPNLSSSPLSQNESTRWVPCACPCSLFRGLEGKNLGATIRGALIAETPQGVLLAVPLPLSKKMPTNSYMRYLDKIPIYDYVYDVYMIL